MNQLARKTLPRRPKRVRNGQSATAPARSGSVARLAAHVQHLSVLFHRRWALLILSQIHQGDLHPGGIKFITLVNRLSISRDSLRQTLDHLIKHDLILRNPGYGHPMRPEYLLADAGYEIAPACRKLSKVLSAAKLEEVGLRKWSMPVLYAISRGAGRFGELKTVLGAITSRALTLALKDLASAGLIRRQIIDAYPPTTHYHPTAKANKLIPLLQRL